MKYAIIACLLLSSCAAPNNGSNGHDGVSGADGQDGMAGEQGSTGPAGASCSVSQSSLGALIACPDGTTALVLHGQKGATGTTGKRCNKKGCK